MHQGGNKIMSLTRKSVELLAPAGTWDALTADVESGADAVYLGGKHFNMRMHEGQFNFDDEHLRKALEYAHAHNVKIYITLNNLISDEEIPQLKEYLSYLNQIQPDAILVQDFAVLKLIHDMGIHIPLHASVMMNTHNIPAIEKLKEYGIRRVVTSREMTLNELSLFHKQTGIELEYFIHGDMCVSESGQCIHSGVLFGQSGNRGRCLKPCRWKYTLIDESDGTPIDNASGPYKLALKDMCMYRNLPELIQAGVYSFKIEGRMRPAPFLRRIVSFYRQAIDAYFHDPSGYTVNEESWKQLYDHRARDFTTNYAFGAPGRKGFGYSGTREPRFFSEAKKEAGFQDEILKQADAIQPQENTQPMLSVRVNTPDSAKSAINHGADLIYVGGEAYQPLVPWTLDAYREIISYAAGKTKVILSTPRTTYWRECQELKHLFAAIKNDNTLRFDGIAVSNLGSLRLARKTLDIPLLADFSFNLFNHLAAAFLKDNGVRQATASYELSYAQLKSLVEQSPLPIEVVVHGSYESMICDHDLVGMNLPSFDALGNQESRNHHYALKDTADEIHALRIDQFGRNHIYFAKDLCLYPYLEKLQGVHSFRIEAQDYTPEWTGWLTGAYRSTIDSLARHASPFQEKIFSKMKNNSPRELGIGAFRFRLSRDSI
jgi:putative protease